MNVKLVSSIKKADFITHGGSFHADDVFSTVFLSKIFKKIKLIRLSSVSDEDVFDKLVYDIGYGKFDHHQSDFNKTRQNGIKYASFGLLWQEYGKQYLKSLNVSEVDYLFNYIDREFIEQVDAIDNGEFPIINAKYSLKNLDSLIGSFNPLWNEEKDYDKAFLNALSFANVIFEREIKGAISKFEAKKLVEEEIKKQDGPILVLDKYLPYKEAILNSEDKKASNIMFVITPSNREGYGVHTVIKNFHTKETRLDFPKEWGGLQKEDLQKVTGVKTAMFCHKNLFLATTKTKEDAILLANLALKQRKDD